MEPFNQLLGESRMSTWRYIVAKIWITICHREIDMARCSFHSTGKGWLVNLSVAINRIDPHYTKEAVVALHARLEAVAVRLAWMIGPDDAIQFVTGEDETPRQFYKQWLKKDDGRIEVSERRLIHEAQPGG